ncbi:DUF2744 domain-containing protein [Rhodococcus hoagii]|nr:DUF2744 domain-containing protein [Prescottella equi]
MIPIQSKCDMNVPEEHCLWALVGIESTGVPMLTSEVALRQLSAQLFAAGFRHHPELQEIKVQTPPGAEVCTGLLSALSAGSGSMRLILVRWLDRRVGTASISTRSRRRI